MNAAVAWRDIYLVPLSDAPFERDGRCWLDVGSAAVYYRGKPFIYKGERVQQVSNNIYKTTTHVLRYNVGYDQERAEDCFVELPSYFDIPTLRRLNDFYLIDKNHLYYDEN